MSEEVAVGAIKQLTKLEDILAARDAVEERLRAHMDELDHRLETLASYGIQLPPRTNGSQAAETAKGKHENPKFKVNPKDPSQVWRGRGRKPNWLIEQEEAAS